MLDIGWTELLVVGLILIVVVGPKDLPKVLRTIGQWTRKVKKIARDFQDNIEDIARESEIDEVRNNFNETINFSDNLNNSINPKDNLKEMIMPNITEDELDEIKTEESGDNKNKLKNVS
ncbi:MAG: Sec-independent protein translocase protein TatB [Alphaproteobacteria bacterium MarineAlpha2_Bin1]|nr:MAG: Sec-independent protein translocase protein TatB [Alphaproteobacteria bacterium MarineAlpha2_Bin1]